jgi:hypothetical protein
VHGGANKLGAVEDGLDRQGRRNVCGAEP